MLGLALDVPTLDVSALVIFDTLKDSGFGVKMDLYSKKALSFAWQWKGKLITGSEPQPPGL